MNQGVITPKAPRTLSVWLFIPIILIYVGVLSAAGWYIGDKYFWTNADLERTKAEIAQYEQMVKDKPKNLEYKVALGYKYYLVGRHEDAIVILKSVLDQDKNYFPAYLNLGYVYFDLENYNEALKNFDKCTKLAPKDYIGWMNVGVTSYKMGNIKKSYETLNKAMSLNRGSADIHYHLGVASELNKEKDLAIEQYEEALNFDPNYKEAKEALKRLRKG